MIDLNTIIPALITDITTVYLGFPKTKPDFPCAIFTIINNMSDTVLSGVERLSSTAFQIDVYDDSINAQTASDLANDISARIIANGFSRVSCMLIPEGTAHRITMRFAGKIDTADGMVYRQ